MAYYGQQHYQPHRGDCNCFSKSWTHTEQLVADEFIRRDAGKSCTGRMCECLGQGWYKRQSLYFLYLFAAIGVMIGVGVLIGVGVGLVMPYTRSLNYKDTVCHVTRTTYDTKRPNCGCGKYCTSSYPCLEIFVNYTRYDNIEVTGLLRENEQFGECTYKPGCSNDFNTNANRVLEYKAKYGSGNYSCLYDAALGSTKVIRTRMLGSAGMLHALLWPSVFIAISLACIIFLLCACGTRYVCVTNPPRDVAEEANARMSKGTTNVAFQAPVHTLTVTPHY